MKNNKLKNSQFILLLFVYLVAQPQVTFGLEEILPSVKSTINPTECGLRISQIRAGRLNKIVGGQQADPEDWGWQASLEYSNSFICGGSLINTEWVVTAAHCIISNNPSQYTIKLGLFNRLNPESYSIERSVSQIISHPLYDDTTEQNDIALMKLSSPVVYTDQILPICLPSQNYDFSNQQSWATGWGTLSSGGSTSNYLMEVEIPILSETNCRLKYFNTYGINVNTVNSICAGETGNGKDTCQGDSGGPLVVQVGNKWQLAGITSWGFGCGDGGVYTKTSYFINWITENVQGVTSKSTISSSSTTGTSSPQSTTSSPTNSTLFDMSQFFQISDTASSSRLVIGTARQSSSLALSLDPLYVKFREILGSSTQFKLDTISNGNYDLAVQVTRASQTDANFIPTQMATISQTIEQNKQALSSTIPSNIKYSIDTSKIKSLVNKILIENGNKIITDCVQNSASEDFSCVKTTIYSNGTIVNGTSFVLPKVTLDSSNNSTDSTRTYNQVYLFLHLFCLLLLNHYLLLQ